MSVLGHLGRNEESFSREQLFLDNFLLWSASLLIKRNNPHKWSHYCHKMLPQQKKIIERKVLLSGSKKKLSCSLIPKSTLTKGRQTGTFLIKAKEDKCQRLM